MKNYTRFLFSLLFITLVFNKTSGKSTELEVNYTNTFEVSTIENVDDLTNTRTNHSSIPESSIIKSFHSEIPGLNISNFYAPQTFSGLGAADSGGTGFKTINNIAELVASNNLNHDLDLLYGSDESFSGGTEVLTIQADNVDAESFDLNDIRIANFTGSSTYTGTTIQYFDKDDNQVGSMTISGTLTTTETSVNPLFSGDDLPILGVAKIVFTVTGGGPPANFEIRSIDFTSPVVPTPCSDPDVPTLTSSPSTVCVGSSATINISGSLNDANAWHIYTGSCGGTLLGTTTTGSFSISAVNTATTYFVRGEGGCVTPSSCSTITITPTPLDDASFISSDFCESSTNTISGVATAGGVFSISSQTGSGGATIDSVSGILSNFLAGDQITIQYTTPSSGCQNTSVQVVNVTPLDDADFTSTDFCESSTNTISGVATAGGVFSISSQTGSGGATIDSVSGILSNFIAGDQITIQYTTPSSGCQNTSTQLVNVTPLDDASFNYSAVAYCADDSDPVPTVTGLGGGAFSSSAGLSLNASSGAIDVSASTPGTYSVTYTTGGTCPNTSTATVTINGLDDASFSYSASSYSASDADPTPTITGLGGGSFSSGLGLVVNSMTGTIDLSASTAGTYLVTYTTTGTCPNSASQSVTIASNDNLATPTALVYGAGCTGSIYNIQDSTLELGEDIPDCAFDTGAPFAPAQASSQWFTFVASSSGDALIKITDDGIDTFGPQSPSIALTLALYEAPSTPGDFSTLGSAIACSSSSVLPGVELLDGTFIDAKGLTAGNTYYVQVYSNDNSSIDYCIDVSEPVIYTYNNGWQAPNGNPELVNNPHKRVEVLAGDAFQQPSENSTQPIPPSVGSLYVAQNASVSYDYLLLNYKMEIDGALNPLSGGTPSTATAIVIITNQSLSSISGTGNAYIGAFVYVNENGNANTVDVDLEMDVYEEFQMSDRSINFLKTITFKSTDDRTAVYNPIDFTSGSSENASITGMVQVEKSVPENNSVTGRAYRFVSSPLASMSTIFSQWQENGAAPLGFGTHITGTSGTVGMVDAATGFDQTSSGANSMRTYSNDTSQSFNVVTSTNQAADSLKVAQAYLLYIRGDRTVDLSTNTSSNSTVLRSTGTLEHKPISKSYDVEQGDFIFTGNPYQNAVNVEDLIDASTNIEDDVVYYWDPTLGGLTGSGGAYVTYTGFDGGGAGVATPASANNGFIQPGQAVFVRANAGANGPTNDAVISYRPAQTDISGLVTIESSGMLMSTPSTGPASISMSLYDTASFTSGNSLSDGLLIRFGSNYSNAIGTGDYTKIMNFDESVAVEQVANNYAVAGRSIPVHNEVIQLNHYNYGDTDYTYTINVTGLNYVNAYIYDQYKNTSTPLVDGFNTFNFMVDTSITGSIAADRFQLRFENVTLGIEDTIAGAAFTMYPNPAATNAVISMQSSQLVSKQAKLRVTDLSGKLISDRAIEFSAQGLYEWKDSDLKTGLYILEVSTEEGDKLVRKLVIE